MRIQDIMNMTSSHRELLTTINAKSIVGKLQREDVKNLHWIAYHDIEELIVKHDQEEQESDRIGRAAFMQVLKSKRKHNMMNFYLLKYCVTILAAYDLVNEDLLKMFNTVDDEYMAEYVRSINK